MNNRSSKLFLIGLLCFASSVQSLFAQDSLEMSLQWESTFRSGVPFIKNSVRNSFEDTLEVYGNNWRALRADPEDYHLWYPHSALSRLEIELQLKNFYFVGELGVYRDFEAQYQSSGTHNLPTAISEVDFNIPRQAFIGYEHSIGKVQAGRFAYKLGPSPDRGVSLSSLTTRDALWAYWDFAQFHAEVYFSSLNPWLIDATDSSQNEYLRQSKSLAPNQRGRIYNESAKSLMVHRLAWQHPRFILGLTELAVIGGKNIDLKDLSPFTAWHNNFGAGYTNTWLTFDFTWLGSNYEAYVEWSLDDINAGASGGEGEGTRPTTGAMLLGLHFELPTQFGLWDFRTEWIYVDPTFGLHELPLLQLTDRQRLTSNYRVREEPHYADHYIIDSPLGYYRGPDLIDLWVDLNWSLASFKIATQFAWLQKGENRIDMPLQEAQNYTWALEGKVLKEILFQQKFSYQSPFGLAITTGYHYRGSKDSTNLFPLLEIAYIYRL